MLENLKMLIGKKYKYRGIDITIKNVKIVSGIYIVFTDKRTYNFFENETNVFINELKNLPIKEKKYEIKPMEEQIIQTKNTSTQDADLSSILLETISKVQRDKTYIAQANAICNVVTQMINIKKLELMIQSKK